MIHIVSQPFRIHFNRDIKLVQMIFNFIQTKNLKCLKTANGKMWNVFITLQKNIYRSNYEIAHEKFQSNKFIELEVSSFILVPFISDRVHRAQNKMISKFVDDDLFIYFTFIYIFATQNQSKN